ncbi:MAG TPA: hypothetical protein VGI39_01475 [Polyangiaceae bacterium]|jgi:hypothetical protein
MTRLTWTFDETWAASITAALIVGLGACAIFGDAEAPAPYTCRDCDGECFRGVCEPTFRGPKNGITKDPAGAPLDAGDAP